LKGLITICARGGSKGIPRKNIKPINGTPLISYTIQTAQRFAQGKDVQIGLSSDSSDIIHTASKYGLETDYRRPVALGSDTAGKLDVIKALLIHQEKKSGAFDYVIDMDVTSPLRTPEDIETALDHLMDDPLSEIIFSVNKAQRNPYFNMVEQGKDGYYKLVKEGKFLTRQSAPKVYDLNASFYIFKRSFFEKYNSVMTPHTLIYEMPHLCFDLDEPVDFEFMEYLLVNKKLDFVL
jgi:CMP-N-acetylneuraminic acid synthetase